MTKNYGRKIEEIERFCCRVDWLIELVNEKPDWISRDSSTLKAKADIWGKELNNLAVKIWPKIHFDKANQPYQPKDVPAHMDLVGVFSATPSHIESITRRWQEWKERAIKVKGIIQKQGQKPYRKEVEIMQREAEAGVILKHEPNIILDDLADRLGVSTPTACRLKVWKISRKRPPRDRFPKTIPPDHS